MSTLSGRVGTVRFVRVGWAAVVLAVVVAGCTGEGAVAEPTLVGSSSALPSVSSAATATAHTSVATSTSMFIPVQPQDLPPVPVPEQTSESAVEFLEWWFAMLNRSELTGETALIRQNSLPECVFCEGQISNIESINDGGRHLERAGDTTIFDLTAETPDVNGYVLVQFTGETPAGRSLDKAGNVVSEFPAVPPTPLLAGIQWMDGRWILKGVGARDEP